MKFNSTMLREKFVVQKPPTDEGTPASSITAASARLPISLQAGNLLPENFVVRAHNMHSCVRFAGKIVHDYDKRGPILNRSPGLNFQEHWEDCLGPYERHNCEPWACVYHNGKPYFAAGEHHPFLDVIEKCDVLSRGNYDSSIRTAREAVKQSGSDATISYDSTVALVANLDRSTARCGMVLRQADRTNNFNINIQETATSGKINIALGLSVSAAFLEGVQLGFFIGQQQARMRRGLIKRFSQEDKSTREARERLVQLDAEINACENRYTVRYRPERPNFLEIIEISQRNLRGKDISAPPPADSNFS